MFLRLLCRQPTYRGTFVGREAVLHQTPGDIHSVVLKTKEAAARTPSAGEGSASDDRIAALGLNWAS